MNETVIEELVHRFYGKIRADEMLGPIFDGAIGDRWDSHLATMRLFWSSVMLGSATYKGNPLAVHLRLPIASPRHFERWLCLWRETTAEVCGDQAGVFVEKAESIARRLILALASGRASAQTVEIVT
ncbi:MAG: group III truncated hemoglobin [Bryobacterales bacterium]|nr:group III truncated hemoglobin [Bryobacterales bacterium]